MDDETEDRATKRALKEFKRITGGKAGMEWTSEREYTAEDVLRIGLDGVIGIEVANAFRWIIESVNICIMTTTQEEGDTPEEGFGQAQVFMGDGDGYIVKSWPFAATLEGAGGDSYEKTIAFIDEIEETMRCLRLEVEERNAEYYKDV